MMPNLQHIRLQIIARLQNVLFRRFLRIPREKEGSLACVYLQHNGIIVEILIFPLWAEHLNFQTVEINRIPGAGRFDFQPLIRNGIQYILKGFTGVHDFRHINRVHIKMIDNSIQ